MSDSDNDNEILEDIKALEDVLAQDSSQESFLQRDDDDDVDDDEEGNPTLKIIEDPDWQLDESTSPTKLKQQALELNQTLITKLKSMKEKIENRLLEIVTEKKNTEGKIKVLLSEMRKSRPNYEKAGYPYFKDKRRFSTPHNEDTILKMKRNEVMPVYDGLSHRWTPRDKTALLLAVKNELSGKSLAETAAKNQGEIKSPDEIFRMQIRYLGSVEFDWLQIAAHEMNDRHTADECRVMWKIYLHPDISRQRFSAAEDKSLLEFAQNQGFEDWDLIGQKLGTGRTGFLCFLRYLSIDSTRKKHLAKNAPWSETETNALIKIIEALRLGSYISWGTVAFYCDTRVKTQIYNRWQYTLNPLKKKGRFTSDEDELLLEGVTKYGKDFPRISAKLLPHRTSLSLSGRFTLLMLKTDQSYNAWTPAEDMLLLQLYDQLGAQWSKISQIMNKNRTYVRHRYFTIGRHLSQKRLKANADRDFDEVLLLSDAKIENELDIDTRLRRFFKRNHTPIATPGRQLDYTTLQSRCKKLGHLFNFLDVHLTIPENLDIPGLTPKDKELMTAYTLYSKGHVDTSTARGIEKLRLKMFGPDETHNDSPPFIPPPPFGICFKQSSKSSNNRRPKSDDALLPLNLEFELVENIEKMLSEDEQKIFRKLSNLISSSSSTKTGEVDEAFEEKFVPINRREVMETNDEHDLVTTTGITQVSWGRKIGLDSPLSADDERGHLLPPCYSSLIGYEMMRSMKELNGNLEWTRDEREMSKKPVSAAGKQAFHLFKSRFFKLLKYPIGMVRAAESKSTQSDIFTDLIDSSEEEEEEDTL